MPVGGAIGVVEPFEVPFNNNSYYALKNMAHLLDALMALYPQYLPLAPYSLSARALADDQSGYDLYVNGSEKFTEDAMYEHQHYLNNGSEKPPLPKKAPTALSAKWLLQTYFDRLLPQLKKFQTEGMSESQVVANLIKALVEKKLTPEQIFGMNPTIFFAGLKPAPAPAPKAEGSGFRHSISYD